MTNKYKNAFAAVILTMSALLLPAIAQVPSDLITYQAPPTAISLQNVAYDSLMAISATNAELCPRRNWEIPTLGRYSSQAVAVEQSDNESIDAGLQKFAQGESKMPASIGNATGNITKINGTMIWM